MKKFINFRFVLLVVLLKQIRHSNSQEESQRCHDALGKPQRCIPEFINAAFNKRVESTNTCGEDGPSQFCIQGTGQGSRRPCDFCDARNPHPPEYLTDLNNNDEQTWWQSGTMYEDVEWPNRVNLTLHLRKSFDITYVQLKFHSPRPESFAIYKRTSENSSWVPYQFYSAQCRGFYGVPDLGYVDGGEETRALCTSEFSDISPLTGGSVAFSTLEGRPSGYNFDSSDELQEFVTATDIRITLDRHNTFGDELFSDIKVLMSYFYAITDLAVGGRCKCNGHASQCVPSSSTTGEHRLVCQCEHNTSGPDCNECLPFYWDRPWARASATDANECRACNCNGFSDRCVFNQKQYEQTGHGGVCTDCRGNRDGANCQNCKPNFFQRSDGFCIPCHCNEKGSRSLQCNSEGNCQCKAGVAGNKCDNCQANFYDFNGIPMDSGSQGCKSCSCSIPGSVGNEPNCDHEKGNCRCKENVEQQSKCAQCRPGYFNLDLSNEFGCTPCFCFGHSSLCQSAPGYGQVLLESIFARSNERWTAEEMFGRTTATQYNALTQNLGISSQGREAVYFVAPDRFLGDQRGSYNQELNFTLRIGEHSPKPSADDVILEGAGIRVSRPIFGQRNSLPSIQNQEFSFRLHENPDFGWNPRLTARDFISVLSNLTSIKIRGTFTPRGVGFLDNVKLKTARRGSAGFPVQHIETCTCPEGYIGQFCESCSSEFTHRNGGPFAKCVRCSCNNHTNICDPESGQCICPHNTSGDNCEKCLRGFYGNALKGTPDDCRPCPCPNQGACIQLQDEQIVCLECPTGYAGPQCEFCGDGYFGDPSGQLGEKTACQPCQCNENIDPNAVGNCNRTTGECLKCIYNSHGSGCEQCAPGFYGDALAIPKGDCKPCACNALGTIPTDKGFVCDPPTGQCPCNLNVVGRQCDMCKNEYYNLASGMGCEDCLCDLTGSINGTCDMRTGQCFCNQGVVGLRCNDCAPNHFGFSDDGCEPCDCDPFGSIALQCSPDGQCPCRTNMEGKLCNLCAENTRRDQSGCVDCPPCYNLVQEAVNKQRKKLEEMEKLLEDIANTPTVHNDSDFEKKLAQVQQRVDQLWTDAKSATGGDDKSLLEKVNELKDKIKALDSTSKQIRESVQQCSKNTQESAHNLTASEETIKMAQETLKNAQRYVDSEGKEALERAEDKSHKQSQQISAISELARDARLLADQHEEEAVKLEKVGITARNTSLEAYNIAWDSIQQQRNANDESRSLTQSVQQLEEDVKVTESKAKNALEVAKESYDNSLNLFKDAYSLTLPTIDFDDLKDKAKKAKAEATEQKENVETFLKEREQLLADAHVEAQKAQELIANTQEHQQKAEELLADLDKAKASADKALKQSNDTYEEAKKIYNTLQDFTKNVEESKIQAEKAKLKIPQIQEQIYYADGKTKENRAALHGAKEAASRSLLDADEAKNIAEKASQEAFSVRAECEDTKERAKLAKDEATGLNNQVAETLGEMTKSEDKVNEEDVKVKAALDKASEAQSKSSEGYDKVQKALSTIRDIALALNNLDTINEAGLEGLGDKITEVERELEAADLDAKIEALRSARNKQTLWIKNYEDELDSLKKEVENVQEIRSSLDKTDTKCWKRTRLEP